MSEANIDASGDKINDTFSIVGGDGAKVRDAEVLRRLEGALRAVVVDGKRVAGRPEFSKSRSSPYSATQLMGARPHARACAGL